MEKEKNNGGLFALLVVIIVILITLLTLIATGNIKLRPNSNNNDTTNNDSNTDIEAINSFLISDNFIATSNVVADNMPDGYVFLKNGKFAYHNPSFYDKFVESEEHRLISYIGTWSIDGNKLVLNISKEDYALGGEINKAPAGNYLLNYKHNIKDVNKKIEYTINNIDSTSDYLPFISLSLDDNEVKLYSLPGVGDYIEIPRLLAEEGYNTIWLSGQYESFVFDKLDLSFNGTIVDTANGYYNYVLDIKYDGKQIDGSIFNDKNNYRIWSHNMAADFKIYKVDNVYVLLSFRAKQCFGNDIIFMNTDGDVLKSFTNAEFKLDNKQVDISTSDNGQCMGDGWESHVTEYIYTIDDSNLIEQKN